ncbi:MAG TPA: transposase [Gemmataceae bacterium]|jgi:hypothetical protein|nr:transposase [Gemmataceae bacterium]
MASWILTAEIVEWVFGLASVLDARVEPRLGPLLTGALFAEGRRTVSRWIAAAGMGHDFKRSYYALSSVGRKSGDVAAALLRLIRRVVPVPERVVLALDDTLTKRYGPKVEGAGTHHNPTPGPADAEFAYGHVWVTLAWVVRHPVWGTIALPLLSKLYVRVKDFAKIAPRNRWAFRTKLELAAGLLEWAALWFSWWQVRLWVVVDGGYAKRPFLQRACAKGVTVVGRLRKDAALCDVPPERKRGQRGRPPKYGERIDLARRANHPKGWRQGEFHLYGKKAAKTYKTFLATYRPAGGVIRVVIVKEAHGWFAWLCTDPEATVDQILEAVADRAAIEQLFHDVKEVHGAGEQQLRHVWANIGAWHLLLWLHTLIELWAWNRPESELVDRSGRPWDAGPRRPSHADKRNALRRACLEETFSTHATAASLSEKTRHLVRRLVSLVS